MKSWEPWGGTEQVPGEESLQEGFTELESGERMSRIRVGRKRGGPLEQWPGVDPIKDWRVFRGAWVRLHGCQCSEPHNLSDQRPSYRLGTFYPCAESSGLWPTLGPGVSTPKMGLSLIYPWSHHWPAGRGRGEWRRGHWAGISHSTESY